jgi:hypothetical protein
VSLWVSKELVANYCSECAKAAYLFALVLQLILGVRPGRRHMRFFPSALCPGVCRCAVASNPYFTSPALVGDWMEAWSQVVVGV